MQSLLSWENERAELAVDPMCRVVCSCAMSQFIYEITTYTSHDTRTLATYTRELRAQRERFPDFLRASILWWAFKDTTPAPLTRFLSNFF